MKELKKEELFTKKYSGSKLNGSKIKAMFKKCLFDNEDTKLVFHIVIVTDKEIKDFELEKDFIFEDITADIALYSLQGEEGVEASEY